MAYDKSLPVSSHNRIPCGEEGRGRHKAAYRSNGKKKGKEKKVKLGKGRH